MGSPIVVTDPAELALRTEELRRDGMRIALVPTMGALHAGHARLLEEARRRADTLVLSIFVNPIQFGPSEDLSRYPRDLDADLVVAARAEVDLVFAPSSQGMYPEGAPRTRVIVHGLTAGMCGPHRPGHFEGVATVVTKLFGVIRPHLAVFGEKDYQQLAVVRRLVLDLDLRVEIVGVPTVRDADGLALSSRNVFLSAEERARALAIPRALTAARAAVAAGARDVRALVDGAMVALAGAGEVQYVELRDAVTLDEIATLAKPGVLAMAMYVGGTRLIDNVVLTPPA